MPAYFLGRKVCHQMHETPHAPKTTLEEVDSATIKNKKELMP